MGGGAAAHNKLPEVEQLALEQQAMDRKIRLVNSGCSILKSPMWCLLEHSSAKRVAKDLQPFQLAYSASAGPQVKCAITRAMFETDYFVSLQDAVNAFNALKRQDMMDAVATLWPEATLVYNKVYGIDGPCFYVYEDDDGTTRMRVTRNEERTHMGRAWGVRMGIRI